MEQFGKYQLRERIAVGGMAEVFDAILPGRAGFERRVAIKRILPQFSADESFLSMFVDEAKIAVQLSHSNIAQILELGCVDGAYFIAMEFVEGRDLRFIGKRLRKREERMPVPVACYLVMQVAEALAFAHEATGRDGQPLSVTHRDLSPHNVMVTDEGGVKVIDFGLAKAMGRATQTRKGVLKGKLAYMSPEQSLGRDVDPRSDLFSLGACFYEMLTGERLFMRATQVATVTAVRESTPPPIRSIVSEMPFELEAIVTRCLAKDPDGRYQSAQELHDAVQGFVYHQGCVVGRRQIAEWLEHIVSSEDASGSLVASALSSGMTHDESQLGPATSRHMRARRITEDPLVDSTRGVDPARRSSGSFSSENDLQEKTADARESSAGPVHDVDAASEAEANVATVEALVDQPTDSIEIEIELDGFSDATPALSKFKGKGLDPAAPPPVDTIEIRPDDLARLVKSSSEATDESKDDAPTWDAGPDTQRALGEEVSADHQGEDATDVGRPPMKELGNTEPAIPAEDLEAEGSSNGYRPPPPSRLAGGPRRGD